MPNICENTIQIQGKKEDIDRLIEATKTIGHVGRFDMGEKEHTDTLDLCKAHPVPEEFKLISTGANNINGNKVDLWWYRSKTTGEITENDIFSRDEDLVAEEIPQEYQDELTNKYGTNNWYDWTYDNWSTKWVTKADMEELSYDEFSWTEDGKEKTEVNLEFVVDSAWGPPIYLLQKIADDYNFRIGCRWWEEGGEAGWEHIQPQEH